MISKIKAAWDLMRKGKMVNDPEKWKKGQITVDALHSFIWAAVVAVAAFTGHEIPITGEAIDGISTALVAAVPAVISLWDVISTIITTEKVGLQNKPKSIDE